MKNKPLTVEEIITKDKDDKIKYWLCERFFEPILINVLKPLDLKNNYFKIEYQKICDNVFTKDVEEEKEKYLNSNYGNALFKEEDLAFILNSKF
jgi:hypothetical protein